MMSVSGRKKNKIHETDAADEAHYSHSYERKAV